MPEHPQDAVTEQQRLQSLQKIPELTLSQCIQRLENLQTHFLHIGSVDELRDAVVEAGTIVAQIVYYRLGNYLSIIPAGANRQMLEYFAGYCLLHIPKSGGLDVLPWKGMPFTEKRRRYYREQFWLEIAECSDQPRNVLNGSIGPVMFHFQGDFKQQAKRYNLLVSEQIANLLAEQPSGSTDAKPKQGYSEKELGIAIKGVIADTSQRWTAKKVQAEINAKCPDRYIGSSSVGEHPTFKAYKVEKSTTRNRGSGKARTITTSGDTLDHLINPTGRKTKPPNKDDRADGD